MFIYFFPGAPVSSEWNYLGMPTSLGDAGLLANGQLERCGPASVWFIRFRHDYLGVRWTDSH